MDRCWLIPYGYINTVRSQYVLSTFSARSLCVLSAFFRASTLRSLVIGISVFVTALGLLAACSPLTALNAVTPTSTYERVTASYGPHPRHTLDVYLPLPRPAAAPVVVFFHGGTWNSGDRTGYVFLGEALASRGMVAVIANTRLYPEVRYPGFLEDGAKAVSWVEERVARYGGDPAKIFLMGHSSGAYNAAMLALDERWLEAAGSTPAALAGWIGLAGPYDFLPIENPDVKPVFFHPQTPPSSQPIHHVDTYAPPALLIAPSRDELVNPERNTGGLSRRLREAGVPVEEIYYRQASHTTLIGAFARPLRSLVPVLDEVTAFVRRHADAPHSRLKPGMAGTSFKSDPPSLAAP